MSVKTCCFIGHRNVPDTEDLRRKIKETAERLIIQDVVTSFLFGSRSNFDSICHSVITELQKKYPNIKRVVYTCRHEYATMKNDRAEQEQILSKVLKHSAHILDYDGEYEYPTKYTSGKASYVERNQAMIDDSDFCIFCYDENYLPPRRKNGNGFEYQPQSGTSIAYAYAIRKKKTVFNIKL